jgi:hypothetical protein
VGQAVFEKKLKIKESNMRLQFIFAMIASMLFAADAAYALGGGGHGGDGRRDSSQPANVAPQAVNHAVSQDVNHAVRQDVDHAVRQDGNDQEENPGNPNNPPCLVTAVPEPITALLLGIGICLTTGFMVTKRKQRS